MLLPERLQNIVREELASHQGDDVSLARCIKWLPVVLLMSAAGSHFKSITMADPMDEISIAQ